VGSPETGETTRILTVSPALAISLGSIDLTGGPGLLHRMISASGGTVKLNNGNSTTDFYLPPTGSSENLLFVGLGLGTAFSDYRIDLNALITDIGGASRALDATFTFSYAIL
jgi:hypothetical protein